ncbi:hypothetical protein ACFP3U_02455 [Kitasatospora misakiensis]|uniref:Uncharacterized protein n=1 Tax=Kitasatospora misakiensis TaxID=67330 RepID=A0ABW0WZW0_9ACTN
MSVEDEFEDFQGEFARALRGAAALAPDTALFSLAAGAERCGRRRRNRRRAAMAGALAATVLAVGGVGAFVGVPGVGGFGAVAAEPPVQPMTADEVVEVVTSLLPPGSVKKEVAETPGTPGPAGNKHETFGVLRFDDGKGESILTYNVERGAQKPAAAAVCMDPFQTPQDSCDRTVRPDGSVLVIDKLRDRSLANKREWRATWATPDGTVIRIIEYNGQPASATRETPPLDSALLTSLVTAPAWQRVVAALPAHPKAPKPGEPPTTTTPEPTAATPSPAELLTTLTKLLPEGSQTSAGNDQHAALTVTFEGRTSMISVSAQPAGKRGLDDKKSAEEGTPTPLEVHETLPDGTLLVLNQFGNGKTAVNPLLHWTAKVYYPDGRNILLNEWNGENGYDFRPGQPAFSVEQLKAVVMAPDWRK